MEELKCKSKMDTYIKVMRISFMTCKKMFKSNPLLKNHIVELEKTFSIVLDLIGIFIIRLKTNEYS